MVSQQEPTVIAVNRLLRDVDNVPVGVDLALRYLARQVDELRAQRPLTTALRDVVARYEQQQRAAQ